MTEQLCCILNRIDGRHLSKLWLFYRDFFPDDASCLQFLYDVLKNEPKESDVLSRLSSPQSKTDIAESGSDICDSDFIPRRMINSVERLVSAARDMERIRRGKDIFKVIFLVTCVETLQNLIGNHNTKVSQLFNFFENYTSDADKKYIASHFILDEDSDTTQYDGFQCFVKAINEYRNCAAHEGDYWDYCFNNNNDGYPLLIILNIDLEKSSRNNKKEHCFHTTISYKAFEEIFIRTCIHFIQAYISNKQN